MDNAKKTSDKRLNNLKPGLTGNATPFTKENQPAPKLKVDGWEARRAKKLLSKTIFEGMEDPKTLHSELKKYGLKFEKSEKKLPVEIMEIYRKK